MKLIIGNKRGGLADFEPDDDGEDDGDESYLLSKNPRRKKHRVKIKPNRNRHFIRK